MNVFRIYFIIFIFSLSFAACKSHSSANANTSGKDSLAYIAPKPGDIPKEDFDRYYNAVKTFYNNDLVAKGFNGGMLVAKNGKVIYEDYHGYFNLPKKDSLTPHSAFHLASISKTFTAMA
ncbi:MAG: serine hydrolase domain-containing protein, partial [Ginsengibacter sp.]